MDHSVAYEVRIRVAGQLPPTWSDVLAGLAVVADPDGTTLLRGEVPDQAALHGLLDAIRDLGLSLVSADTVVILRTSTPLGG
jgi:hypothetical protein